MSTSLLALTACASREHPVPLNTYQSVAAVEPPQPATQPTVYRLNPLDQIRIDVFGEPDISVKELPIDPGGKILVPLAGEIDAEGKTTQELAAQIGTALRRYLRRPQVAVNVTQYTSQKVTVEGSVKMPGVFQALDQMTLMDAIAMGQGLGDYSKEDEIVVFRRQGGQRYVARFDLGAIQTGQAADPTILPGDVVVVGYNNSRRFFSNAVALLPSAVGIFIALLPKL